MRMRPCKRVRVTVRGRYGVTQARWCAGTMCMYVAHLRGLFRKLSLLDDLLDVVFLLVTLFAIAPPLRAFVFALQAQVLACFATWFGLVAFLPS